MNKFVLFLLVLLCMVLPNSIRASSALAEYDQPWEICALCHSLDGNSPMAKFPKLAGQRQDYIEKQLQDFREGQRSNDGGQMSAIVTEFESADVPAIAYWFSSQKHPEPIGKSSLYEAGMQFFMTYGCNQCHSNSQRNSALVIPLLTAQHPQYLAKQLTDFQQGYRSHLGPLRTDDPVLNLTDTEIDALASYLAATARL